MRVPSPNIHQKAGDACVARRGLLEVADLSDEEDEEEEEEEEEKEEEERGIRQR